MSQAFPLRGRWHGKAVTDEVVEIRLQRGGKYHAAGFVVASASQSVVISRTHCFNPTFSFRSAEKRTCR